MERFLTTQQVATERKEMFHALHGLIREHRPAKLIETGTYHGTGSTRAIAGALREFDLGKSRFFSIEVNPRLVDLANKNLHATGLNDYVSILNGLSLPRTILPNSTQISRWLDLETKRTADNETLFFDHAGENRADEYFRETDHSVPDNLLEHCLAKFQFAPDFLMLDSAGHLGFLEFQYVLQRLRGPCHFALDDIFHVKHRESYRTLKSDKRFKVTFESKEQCGFCIASYTPDTRQPAAVTELPHRRPRIFYPLPGLPRNGGVKVCVQHSHLLSQDGYDAVVITPRRTPTPYPAYEKAKYATWDECLSEVTADDIFVFSWAADIPRFQNLSNRFFFFSQGVINASDPAPHTFWLNDRFTLLTLGQYSHDFFLYAHNRDSRILYNWIDTGIFYPQENQRVANRVGMLRHRNHFDEELRSRVQSAGFAAEIISGTETAVAAKLRTCEFFLGCSPGIYNGKDCSEGFALPTAEAMASGCVVVTFNNHGCLEYCFDRVNSFVTAENTRDQLINTLQAAKTSALLGRMREIGVFTIQQRFNAPELLNRLKAALELTAPSR